MTVHNATLQIPCLGSPELVWVVPSIHGDLDALVRLHDQIFDHFRVGQKLVYLGNYTGYGQQSAAVIDELLTFRRLLLSLPGMECSDIVYLRGSQEEMGQKLLQLPFAPQPSDTLLWMLGNGMSATLHSYGICEHDGIEACRAGVMGLTKWVERIRAAIRARPGHEVFSTQFVRACYTEQEHAMLFVNAGVNAARSLGDQGDQFWWAGEHFNEICEPYEDFQSVVRGYDPKHAGMAVDGVAKTLDNGCGFGGSLVAAGFTRTGGVFKVLEG